MRHLKAREVCVSLRPPLITQTALTHDAHGEQIHAFIRLYFTHGLYITLYNVLSKTRIAEVVPEVVIFYILNAMLEVSSRAVCEVKANGSSLAPSRQAPCVRSQPELSFTFSSHVSPNIFVLLLYSY